METINDIVAEMRKRFEPYAKSNSNDARYVAYLGYAEFANRIEQAVTNCNQSKMREALEDSNGLLEELALIGEWYESAKGQIKENNAALSAPPRNCDEYSHDEALRIWISLPESKENGCFDEWLYAEAKGENK